MKKLYCIANEDNSSKDIYVTEEGRPYAFFRYLPEGLNVGDVVSGMVESYSATDGSFFANIGEKKNAFSDDACFLKGMIPLQILAFPRDGKGYTVSPVITFTGLFSVVKFIPKSSPRLFAPLGVSKKISAGIAARLKSEYSGFVEKLSDSAGDYNVSVTLRSLCGSCPASGLIQEEIKGFYDRLNTELDPRRSCSKRKIGGSIVRLSAPEFLSFNCSKIDFDEIVLSSSGDAETFGFFYKRLPFDVSVSVRKHFDGLNKFTSYTGRNVYTQSGARVTYDRTEAMHVFDVNSAGSKLTHTEINLEACAVIASVITVRDLTGIIMCDFINMESPEDEELVIAKMKELRDLDYRPVHVCGFTELKVLECSRSK